MGGDQRTEASAERAEAAHVDYPYQKFGEDQELEEFTAFLRDEYGAGTTVEGDLEAAVAENRDIDVTYRLDEQDAEIVVESYRDDEDERRVSFTVRARDAETAQGIKNTLVAKGDGAYERSIIDGMVHKGVVDDEPWTEAYDDAEVLAAAAEKLRERYGADNVTVKPLPDDINASIGKIKRGRAGDGERYYAEAAFEITVDPAADAPDTELYITRQKAGGDAGIEFRAKTLDPDSRRDPAKDVHRLLHGHALATHMDGDAEEDALDAAAHTAVVEDTDFGDVGGLSTVKDELTKGIVHPLRYPDAADEMGLEPTNGVLLQGPPGTGKTLLARAVAGEVAKGTDATFYNVNMNELVSKYVGETEEHIEQLYDHAQDNAPAVMFIDEADTAIPSRGEADKEHSKSQTNTILQRLDGFDTEDGVVTILATNREEDLDEAGTRSGRIDAAYTVDRPDAAARREILDIHVDRKAADAGRDALFDDIDRDALAAAADGATGADIEVWVEEAVRAAAYRDGVDPDTPPRSTTVTDDDFRAAAEQFDFGSGNVDRQYA